MPTTKQIDLTQELARLLIFIADVAVAIRMYSAYNQSAELHKDAPYDLMWLSDCLHNLNLLGLAIFESNQVNILSACDDLIAAYEQYQVINPHFSRQAKPSFDRNADMFALRDGIDIFKDIRIKLLAS